MNPQSCVLILIIISEESRVLSYTVELCVGDLMFLIKVGSFLVWQDIPTFRCTASVGTCVVCHDNNIFLQKKLPSFFFNKVL